ncbi:MAG: 16S rRNA (guanine(966)-N(2))-methyltransferase RsmD [Oscillospiraceae bacterium]|jgi:16S rRNA (guanine(966)-N(2))-methyltransferase RsmD|nr:16S rRNA (guanine(966)-N(2))-methyltransferase RsmD [Oscillospiraceae bacterium]
MLTLTKARAKITDMRIITGIARGRRLKTPGSLDTRPTAESVKEAVFSALQFDIEGRTALDLFAGSGQLGLETLSRGARKAVFVDKSPAAAEVVRENLETCGFLAKAEIHSTDYALYLKKCTSRFDLAFLDPPYSLGVIPAVLPLLEPLMNENGTVICETGAAATLPAQVGALRLSKERKYGKTKIWYYRKEDA